MAAKVYPFRRLFADLVLDLEEVVVDGSEVPDAHLNRDARTLAVHAFRREKWEELGLRVRVQIPLQEIRSEEIEEGRLAVLIRLNCNETNLRVTEVPAIIGEVATATMSVQSEMLSGNASIEAFLVVDGDDGIPRIIQEATPWKLLLTQPHVREATPGRRRGRIREFVRVRWVDFGGAEHPYPLLRDFSAEAYFVDVAATPPTLFLNEGLPGYRILLSESRSAGRLETALRELEMRRLAMGVWLALTYEAMSRLVLDPDGELMLPTDWAREVLERIVREMYPSDSLEIGMRRLHEMQEADTRNGLLNGMLQATVNRIVGASATLKRHLTSLSEAA